MSFDLISTIELTASAALVVAVLAFTLAATRRGRIEMAALLAAWFALVVFLGATRALDAGPPALAAAVILPVAALSLAFFWLPPIKASAMAMPLPALEAVNAARILGISFVLLYAAGRLPAPFAPIAGWGDILVGIRTNGRARIRSLIAWRSGARQAVANWRPIQMQSNPDRSRGATIG